MITDSIVVMIIIEEELEEVWWVDLVQRLQSWQKHDGKLLTFQKKTSISIPKKNHLRRLPNFLLKRKMVVNLGLKSTTHLIRLLWGKNIKIYLNRLVDLSARVL